MYRLSHVTGIKSSIVLDENIRIFELAKKAKDKKKEIFQLIRKKKNIRYRWHGIFVTILRYKLESHRKDPDFPDDCGTLLVRRIGNQKSKKCHLRQVCIG